MLLENTLILLSLTFWQTLVKAILPNHGWVYSPEDIGWCLQTFRRFWFSQCRKDVPRTYWVEARDAAPWPQSNDCSPWTVLTVEAEKAWSSANSAPLFIKILFDLSIVDLQCSFNFFYTKKGFSFIYIYTYIYIYIYIYTHTHTYI